MDDRGYRVQAHWLPPLLRFAWLNRTWMARGYTAASDGWGMSLNKEGPS